MGRKMFTIRQIEAAVRIQSWWRMSKLRAWFSIIRRIRHEAATKLQRSWRNFLMIRVWPEMLQGMQAKAAVILQSQIKGYLTRKRYLHEIHLYRMNDCFQHFEAIQYRLQKDAIQVIIRHWKTFLARRKEERRLQEEMDQKKKK